jgi:hypothetical protein
MMAKPPEQESKSNRHDSNNEKNSVTRYYIRNFCLVDMLLHISNFFWSRQLRHSGSKNRLELIRFDDAGRAVLLR